MLGKLLPILLAVIGLGAGLGAGIALRPDPEPMDDELACSCADLEAALAEARGDDGHGDKGDGAGGYDYVKLNNQFVVPVVDHGRVNSLVVMSLSLEVQSGQTESIYQIEPKLRDLFLQVMFDHANSGGFSGDFTKTTRMNVLRSALREAAKHTLGTILNDVLIMDVVRQDT
jgi:hypothetical protein